jgi:hypothetical protein
MKHKPVYDIVLLPPQHINELSIKVSTQLAAYGTEFVLNTHSLYPHLSLYMALFEEQALQEVNNVLAHIAQASPALSLIARRYLADQEQGMFEVAYEKSEEINQLQQDIIQALNSLRSGEREKDPVGHILGDWFPHTTGETHENLAQYGYDEIGGLFRPHITFTRFCQRNFLPNEQSLPNFKAHCVKSNHARQPIQLSNR